MEHTLTQLCDINPMLNDIKISSLVFHPYLLLQIPDIKSIKVDAILYDIKVLARCISIWKAHPSGNPNNTCSLDIVFQDHQDLFHNNKDARVTQLDNENRNINIGSLPVTDFFQEINSKAYRLANLDSPVKDTSLVTYAVNGIRSKYPDAARVIRLREKVPTFDELQSMMLLEESDMSHQLVSSTLLHNTPSLPTVLAASTTPTEKANTMNTSGFDVCRNFQRGSCSYGALCKFVHGVNDLRPRPYYQFDTSRSNATHIRDSYFTTGL
nr:Toll/interleukin-1 receptor (TIR) domain-containing protein [Tanacetum cinerariifolium]